MKDRVPTKPNRYAVYDDSHNFIRYEYHERADEPTQEGTPLNKANLLPDSVATVLGLPPTASVADGMGVLAKGCKCVTGSYVGTGVVRNTFMFDSKVLVLRIFASKDMSSDPNNAFPLISDYFRKDGKPSPFYTADITELATGNFRESLGYSIGYYKWVTENSGKNISIDVYNAEFFPKDTPPSPSYTYNQSGITYFYWAIQEV